MTTLRIALMSAGLLLPAAPAWSQAVPARAERGTIHTPGVPQATPRLRALANQPPERQSQAGAAAVPAQLSASDRN